MADRSSTTMAAEAVVSASRYCGWFFTFGALEVEVVGEVTDGDNSIEGEDVIGDDDDWERHCDSWDTITLARVRMSFSIYVQLYWRYDAL